MDLKPLVAGWLERPLPELTRRDVSMPEVPGKADVVIGMRRSGKTYALYQEMHRLVAAGVPRRHILHVNLEDDRLQAVDATVLGEILEVFYSQSPDARTSGAYLFFDEVQVVPGWSRFARRVLDTESARLFVSGSSAKMLSTEVATEFRGRGFAVELLPFSFRESLRHAGVEAPVTEPGPSRRSDLEARFNDYLRCGGFPEAQGLEPDKRIQLLQDYVELVLVRDVVERHDRANVAAVRAFAGALLRSSGKTLSVNRLYRDLRSRGIAVGKDSLYLLVDDLADAFLAFPVEVFRISQRAREVTPKKAYAIDPGLAYAVSHALAEDVGARLETAVYLECRRRLGRVRHGAISYYVTKRGHEVDFVLGSVDEPYVAELVQVCASLDSPQTRARELRGLEEAMTELEVDRATIVTLREAESLTTGAGTVDVVPAWRWFLGTAVG
jgi:predicted AAA+ superfamily ATPase